MRQTRAKKAVRWADQEPHVTNHTRELDPMRKDSSDVLQSIYFLGHAEQDSTPNGLDSFFVKLDMLGLRRIPRLAETIETKSGEEIYKEAFSLGLLSH